jgi:hypothetical protein
MVSLQYKKTWNTYKFLGKPYWVFHIELLVYPGGIPFFLELYELWINRGHAEFLGKLPPIARLRPVRDIALLALPMEWTGLEISQASRWENRKYKVGPHS